MRRPVIYFIFQFYFNYFLALRDLRDDLRDFLTTLRDFLTTLRDFLTTLRELRDLRDFDRRVDFLTLRDLRDRFPKEKDGGGLKDGFSKSVTLNDCDGIGINGRGWNDGGG